MLDLNPRRRAGAGHRARPPPLRGRPPRSQKGPTPPLTQRRTRVDCARDDHLGPCKERQQHTEARRLVRLEEAQALFLSGEDYLEIFDEAHSAAEDRFVAIGPIARGLVLVVWTEWEDDIVRIVSARWATPTELTLFIHYREGQP